MCKNDIRRLKSSGLSGHPSAEGQDPDNDK